MNILYLTQWFDPEPGVIKGVSFVRRLLDEGHEVTVATGFPNYPEGKIYPGYRLRMFQRERMGEVLVDRLPLYPSHDSSSLGRSANFLSFFISALIYGLVKGRRFDIAYVYHPPITVGLAAALFGALHRLKFILEIQDLWPDTIAASGMGGRRLVRLLNHVCNFTYRRAAQIIVQSEGMRSTLIDRGVAADKIAVIRNWAMDEMVAETVQIPARKDGAEGAFNFVYGGNLGLAQGLENAVRAAKIAGDSRSGIRLVLIGEGVDGPRLRALARDIGAANVDFLPRVSQTEIAAAYQAADALLLHLSDQPLFEITIPQKTQAYLSMGKPIVAGARGEVAEILRESGAAEIGSPGDPRDLAAAMLRLAECLPSELDEKGRRGRAFYEEHFSFETGMKRTLNVLDGVAGRSN